MSRTLIDIDDDLLAQAADILGTGTKKDTVNGALAEVVKAELRRRHLDFLQAGGLPDLSDPEVMKRAWR
jgi:Arc/MetJ family transcription regulator